MKGYKKWCFGIYFVNVKICWFVFYLFFYVNNVVWDCIFVFINVVEEEVYFFMFVFGSFYDNLRFFIRNL